MNDTLERHLAEQIARIGTRRRSTDDLPRFPGRLKASPQDFVVEELPAYEPAGGGPHLFLWIEKRDESANHLLWHLERTLGASKFEIGVAGMKDKRAVTRQWVSVPERCEPKLPKFDSETFTLLRAARHGNKLKTGHLAGNRFEIVVRDVPEDALERTQVIADRLRTTGLLNYFGDQRFGNGGETLRLGYELLSGAKSRASLSKQDRRFLLRLALSAAQSTLFNELLERRFDAASLQTVRPGDVMQVVASGGRFVAEDPAAEQPRLEQFEIVPTGPMFGPKMMFPTGEPWAEEERVLAESGLGIDAYARFGKLALGTRRPNLIPLGSLAIDQPEPTALRFRFDLPSGTYATEVLAAFLADEADTDQPGSRATGSEVP